MESMDVKASEMAVGAGSMLAGRVDVAGLSGLVGEISVDNAGLACCCLVGTG